MDMMDHGVGESLASLVLRARLIVRRSSCGVGGPRAHASRIASTSAFSAAKFRSAVAAGDGSPSSAMAAGDCSGPGGDASDARGFADAVDETSSLSLVSRLMDGNDEFFATQDVSKRLSRPANVGNVDKKGRFLAVSAASESTTFRSENRATEGLLLAVLR